MEANELLYTSTLCVSTKLPMTSKGPSIFLLICTLEGKDKKRRGKLSPQRRRTDLIGSKKKRLRKSTEDIWHM